jgi:hypothetical protein
MGDSSVYLLDTMLVVDHVFTALARKQLISIVVVLSATLPLLGADRFQVTLWEDPGRVEILDLYHGPGGRGHVPRPPFRYISKQSSGSTEKVIVIDSRNRIWDVKFGAEARPEVLATRLVWAVGYYADPTYLVAKGHIRGRVFRDARFELRDPKLKFRPDMEWSWADNPFVGTRELNGLRVLVMLLSDWDNKDRRDHEGNTGVLQHRLRVGRQVTYYVTDWGASMGRWGGFFTREKWDCEGYAAQTPEFVKADTHNHFNWGYKGKHAREFKDDITISDVRWLMTYLGRVRDSQIQNALRAAGASPHESRCFARSLRERIEQLRRLSHASSNPAGRTSLMLR